MEPNTGDVILVHIQYIREKMDDYCERLDEVRGDVKELRDTSQANALQIARVEEQAGKRSRWSAIGGLVGGFLAGMIGGKAGGG